MQAELQSLLSLSSKHDNETSLNLLSVQHLLWLVAVCVSM